MSIYPIVKMGHPTLRKVASPVTPSDLDHPEMHTLIGMIRGVWVGMTILGM